MHVANQWVLDGSEQTGYTGTYYDIYGHVAVVVQQPTWIELLAKIANTYNADGTNKRMGRV